MEMPLATEDADTHRLVTCLVSPRPIAWISTVDRHGDPNLAPYSYFNLVNTEPPVVMFSAEQKYGELKHTPSNALETGGFVLNVVTRATVAAMDRTAEPSQPAVNEFDSAALDHSPAVSVAAPRVAECPAHLECTVRDSKEIHQSTIVFGDITHIHIDDSILVDGELDARDIEPVGRLGGPYFTAVERLSYTRASDG